MMKLNSRVTKKQIAEKTGLSISTIDRALNNRGNVKPETLRRIVEASKELDYVVNKSASLLSKGIEISIAVVLLAYPNFFWEQVERGIKEAYAEFRDFGLSVEVFRVQATDDTLPQELQDLVRSGNYDGIAVAAANDQYADLIDEAIDSGMAVATLNVDSPMSKRFFYVGCNYHSAGRLAGELIAKLVGEAGNVALVIDSWTSLQSSQKILGFREVLAQFPRIRMIGPLKMDKEGDSIPASWEKELADVNGIYVSNAELPGVARLKERINSKAALIGHDMSDEHFRLLQSGLVTATICQDPVSQGYMAVKKLFNQLAFQERSYEMEHITRLEVVLKENAGFYV